MLGSSTGPDRVVDEWFEEQDKKRGEVDTNLELNAHQLRQRIQNTSITLSGNVTLLQPKQYGAWLPSGVYQKITEIFGQNLNAHAMKRVAAVSHLLFDTTYETPIRKALKAVVIKKTDTEQDKNLRDLLGSSNTINTRKDNTGQTTSSGDDEYILALVYFIALKELKYHGEEANPIQSADSPFAASYDQEYKQAYDLFISYLIGESTYSQQRDALRRQPAGTVFKKIGDALCKAAPDENSSYTTHQTMTILAHLKSSSDLVILEQSRQNVLDAEIDERWRAAGNLEKSMKELHQMFLDLAGIVRDMNHMVVSIAKKVDKAHVDAATGLQKIMQADREQAKSMPIAAWFFPATTKAEIEQMGRTTSEIKQSPLIVIPSRYDKDPINPLLGRMYHQVWNSKISLPISERIKALMDNYCQPRGFLSGLGRTHSSRALSIKNKIDRLNEHDKKDPIKLGEIITTALLNLDNNEHSYSAFRARCHFVLNELDKMVVALRPIHAKRISSTLESVSSQQDENEYRLRSQH